MTLTLGVNVPVERPFHVKAMLAYLGVRAIPGVEEVCDGVYRRVINWLGKAAVLEVDFAPVPSGGNVVVTCGERGVDAAIVDRVRAMVDAITDVSQVEAHLTRDACLKGLVLSRPGIRIPGAFDAFELSVRAILGQQVSVAHATTLASRLALRFGRPLGAHSRSLSRSFPLPEDLVGADLAGLGVTRPRADAIRRLAELVGSDQLSLQHGEDAHATHSRLLAVPGIGQWTASYIALRALGDPDVFLPGDLGLRQALGTRTAPVSAATAARLAGAWKPFRGYATVHLWTSLLLDPSSPGRRPEQTDT
jgi:AraC family transcriptional regulator of adaptative response / DNA-3-methyladenine glycosylase II